MITTVLQPGSLAKSLDEFAATRAHTLSMMDGLTQAQLDFVPEPNRWSIGEVLDHMLLAERLNREQVAKLIRFKNEGRKPELRLTFSELNVSVAGLPRSLMPLLETPLTLMNMFVPDSLRNYLTRTRVVPFQNPDPATPRRGRLAVELRSDLIASLEDTKKLFQNNSDLDYDEMFIQHPLLGRYDVPGLLRFMSAHEQRHQSQIIGIKRSLRIPISTGCCGVHYG
jgi:hypothetical protein